MTRLFRDLDSAMRDYKLIHMISRNTAGMILIVFFAYCFWLVFRSAEPNTMAVSLLALMAFVTVYLIGGQRAVETWMRGQRDGRDGQHACPPEAAQQADPPTPQGADPEAEQ